MRYTDGMTMQNLMDLCKVKSNDTLYVNDRQVKGKDVQFEIVWSPLINVNLFNALASADAWEQVN